MLRLLSLVLVVLVVGSDAFVAPIDDTICVSSYCSSRVLLTPTTSSKVQAPLTPVKTRGGALGALPGWAAYNDALDKKPLITKSMTSLVGWALGDLIAQKFIGKAAFDLSRFLRLSAFGALYHGPSGHYFYNWLDRKIDGKGPKVVATKVLIDQVFWCPIFMSVFFTYLGLVSGDSLSVIGSKINADLLNACKGSWKVWPLVHAINFRFIPTKLRLFYINVVQIFFNVFLSLIGSK